MKLYETQKSLLETSLTSAMEKWGEMLAEVYGEDGSNDTTHLSAFERSVMNTLQHQIVDAQQLLYLIQDAEEVTLTSVQEVVAREVSA